MLIVRFLTVFGFLFSSVVSPPVPSSGSMDRLNMARSQEAHRKQFSNMHKLSWNADLAAEAASIAPAACDSKSTFVYTGPGRTVPSFVNDTNLEKFHEMLVNATRKGMVLKSMMHLEAVLHPLQTQIGCVETNCTFVSIGLRLQMDAVCIMGPHQTFAVSDLKRGTPGSGCGGLKTEEGLCISPDQNSGGSNQPMGSLGSIGAPDIHIPDAPPSEVSDDTSSTGNTTSTTTNEPSEASSLDVFLALSLVVLCSIQLALQ